MQVILKFHKCKQNTKHGKYKRQKTGKICGDKMGRNKQEHPQFITVKKLQFGFCLLGGHCSIYLCILSAIVRVSA